MAILLLQRQKCGELKQVVISQTFSHFCTYPSFSAIVMQRCRQIIRWQACIQNTTTALFYLHPLATLRHHFLKHIQQFPILTTANLSIAVYSVRHKVLSQILRWTLPNLALNKRIPLLRARTQRQSIIYILQYCEQIKNEQRASERAKEKEKSSAVSELVSDWFFWPLTSSPDIFSLLSWHLLPTSLIFTCINMQISLCPLLLFTSISSLNIFHILFDIFPWHLSPFLTSSPDNFSDFYLPTPYFLGEHVCLTLCAKAPCTVTTIDYLCVSVFHL